MARASWADVQARDAHRLQLQHERMAEVRAQGGRGLGLTRGTSGYYNSVSPLSLQQAATEGFRMSAVVYQCVMKIANPLAALRLGVRQIDSLDYDFNHKAAKLWNRTPNQLWTAHSLKLVAWMQLELAGQSFMYADRGATGQEDPSEIWPIFDPVEVVIDDRTDRLRPKLLGFRVGSTALGRGPGIRPVPLLPSEVLWLRYPDPADPWGAMSPLRAGAWAADLDNYARLWQAGEFRNQAAPPGVVYLGDVSDEQYNTIKADFEARQTGPANARRHLFVAGPTKPSYERMGLSPLEMSYIESRQANALDLMRAFGVPKDLMDGGATYENQRNAKINLWTETLWPKLQVIEAEIDRQQLAAEPTLEAEFDVRKVDALRENIDNIAARAQGNFKAGFLLIDEAREDVGRPALPDDKGQKLFVPRGAQDAAAAEVGALEPSSEITEQTNEGNPPGTSQKPSPAAPPRPRPAPGGAAAPPARTGPPAPPAAARRSQLVAQGAWALQVLAERQQGVLADRQQRKRDLLFDEAYWLQETRNALAGWLAALYEPADVDGLAAAGEARRAHLEAMAGVVVAQAKEAAGNVAGFEARMVAGAAQLAADAVEVALGFEAPPPDAGPDVLAAALRALERRAAYQPPIELHFSPTLQMPAGMVHHETHIDPGAVVVDARTSVEAPKPAKRVTVTDAQGNRTTLERNG